LLTVGSESETKAYDSWQTGSFATNLTPELLGKTLYFLAIQARKTKGDATSQKTTKGALDAVNSVANVHLRAATAGPETILKPENEKADRKPDRFEASKTNQPSWMGRSDLACCKGFSS
jgi:hypothetical protein